MGGEVTGWCTESGDCNMALKGGLVLVDWRPAVILLYKGKVKRIEFQNYGGNYITW